MYNIVSYFDVPANHHQEFIKAGLEDGRESVANETGTLRFEVIKDEENPNRFYLNEAYYNEAAFNIHAKGPYFEKFFEDIGAFADGPHSLIKGTRVEDPVTGSAPRP